MGLAILATLLGTPLLLIWRYTPLPPHWPRIFLHLLALACGARVRVRGERLEKDVIFVSNHVSWCDIFLLGGTTGAAFVAKDDLSQSSFLRLMCWYNRTIFIDREDRRTVGAQIARLKEAMQRPQPIAVFPEGTTGDGRGLLPFSPSLFAAMDPPPRALLIQPVFIDYGDAAPAIAWHGEQGFGDNAWALLSRKGRLDVALHFLDPVDPERCANRKEIAAKTYARIEAALVASQAASEVDHRNAPPDGNG